MATKLESKLKKKTIKTMKEKKAFRKELEARLSSDLSLILSGV